MNPIAFCVPDWDDFSSGANIYNRRIWSVFREEFPDIYEITHEPETLKDKAFDTVILDSLFLESLSRSNLDDHGFLLIGHFLKNLRPALFSDEVLTRETQLLEAMDGIVCTGPKTLECVRDFLPENRCYLIPPGMDGIIPGRSEQSPLKLPLQVLITSNLVREKDILAFLNRLRHYWDKHPVPCSTEIRIIGDAAIHPEYAGKCLGLISTLQEKGLDIRHHDPYEQDRYLHILKRSDLYIHPTFRESYGMSIVEAIQSGVPVLCFHEANASRSVVDGQNGFVCQSPGELFKKWWQLMKLVDKGKNWPFEKVREQSYPDWNQQAHHLHNIVCKQFTN